MIADSTPTSYFAEQYARAADPWGLASRWYEQRKYASSLAVLPQRRYRNAFEPGCSVGVFSRLLAERCDALLCVDHMPRALSEAAHALDGCAHVRLEQRTVPVDWPGESFDLIVVSELAYYLNPAERALLWHRVARTLIPGGTLLAVHWRPQVAEYPGNGDLVHDELDANPDFTTLSSLLDPDFRLDVYQRGTVAARSVATAEGLR